MSFSDLYNQSINDKQAFWGEQAKRIYWHQQPTQILDDSKLPLPNGLSVAKPICVTTWSIRHPRKPAEQDAFVWVSTEINAEMIDNYPNIQKVLRHSATLLNCIPTMPNAV